jgi:hypothetical protein
MSSADFLVVDEPIAGMQRLRARFSGHAYDPHRHETYAVGLTEAGIQAFRYRGVEQASTPRRTIVLHPDELHDGHAVAPEGFVYRMLYVDAVLIADALEGGGLPFVPDAVSEAPCWRRRSRGFPARSGLCSARQLSPRSLMRCSVALVGRRGHPDHASLRPRC